MAQKVTLELEEGSVLPKEINTQGLVLRCDPVLGGFTIRKKAPEDGEDGEEVAEGQFNLKRYHNQQWN